MVRLKSLMVIACFLKLSIAVKVKVVMHSDEDSKPDDEEIMRGDNWEHKKKPSQPAVLPFIKSHKKIADEKPVEYEEEKPTTEKKLQTIHPNEVIFPLIYRQKHINSMFKFGTKWYTWSIEKRPDESKVTNYYVCHEEPKQCDDVGWERTETVPKCAVQINSLMSEDRACVNSFGVEPHTGACDGAEQMKVSDLIQACGPRLRSLWRFVRVGRRPVNAAKPADVNSLVCEDEEECYISIEYRIHHDRITFSLHEPTRGQTFKSALKRDLAEEEGKMSPVTETRVYHRPKVIRDENKTTKKAHTRTKSKVAEGKGIVKERNDSGYANRRLMSKNKIKIREDISEDISE